MPPLDTPTVLKNLTNLFTLGGDYALNGRTYKANVWGCVGLMLLSAVCGGATDLTFSARGYAWQVWKDAVAVAPLHCGGDGAEPWRLKRRFHPRRGPLPLCLSPRVPGTHPCRLLPPCRWSTAC